ncbi:MFS transporter [Pectobacterium odoriferum]|uniref:MFS transporter n=1 Tax=Pectobacterium odoriferum TaxID=78398 RepID=A0ABR4VWB0_9GAMM|nr:MFS transporter [Pectobacterium odoriferum]KGA43612.1 MFS transporter [Pectobacterium odoriferum]MCA6962573.1 MFS transporter [Pectobacterium odoriferum]MCH5010669.1 MFS transporter [Pectobacterium odoriferum]
MNRASALAFTYGSFSAVRMLIGVYHAIFLISMGVTLSQLAFLQVIFSITILVLDFPFAVLADRYRRKYSVVLGVVLTGLFYPLCLQAPDISALILSEISYAAGICLITGAIDGWVLHSLGDERDTFSHYAHLCQQVSSIGSVFAGIIGVGAIYYSGEYRAGYIISMVLMIFIFISFVLIGDDAVTQNSEVERKSILRNAKETLWIFKNTVGGPWFIFITCMFSSGIQIIYHFWQPIILSGSDFLHLSHVDMLTIMFCHIGSFFSQYLANSYMSKFHVSDNKYKNVIKYFSIISSVMCVCLYFMVFKHHIIGAIIAFSLIHGFICTVPVGAKSIFFAELNEGQTRHVSGIVGAVSFSGRVFSVIVLSAISLLPAGIEPANYLLLPTISFFFCGIIILKWMSLYHHSLMRKSI